VSEWTPESWTSRLARQQVVYTDREAVDAALAKLRALPPLVTSWEIERLKSLIADAQRGERFLLQGGDCAETLDDCRPESITSKLKILLQMSLVLVQGGKKPVIRVGRFAGQYAKPRSSPTETRVIDGQELSLPSYFGDLVNRSEFTYAARQPNPHLMVRGYQHAAMTLNFIRSLAEGGFADLHHPEYWDLSFFQNADLSQERRDQYGRLSAELSDALRFMEALGERAVEDLTRVEFFTSHEGLNLLYESAQTRTVPRREGHYDLTTHLPWIGERTRDPDGAHVEFFRGIRNPVGVKVGPKVTGEELVALIDRLNPGNEAGKIVVITRHGAERVGEALPPLAEAVRSAGQTVLWVCDPMHGNGLTTESGIKTRRFDSILDELERAWKVHHESGGHLGGVHFELTGDDVTECIGGASGVTEAHLSENYVSPCDPRLNYQQSIELAFLLAQRMASEGL
jgi:3-deoxy-7-phosphoheptulonate synthase